MIKGARALAGWLTGALPVLLLGIFTALLIWGLAAGDSDFVHSVGRIL